MLYPTGTTDSVAGVIGCADAQLAPLGGRLWAAVSDVELIDGVAALVEHEAHLAALRVHLLAEVAGRELARKTLAWSSTGDWYAHAAGITRAAGHRAVAHSQVLINERVSTLAAMETGAVSDVQATVICDAVDKLPTNPALRAEAEALMLLDAATLDATQLAEAGRKILAVVDPERDERDAEAALGREERAAHLGRELSITDDGAGGIRVRGRGTVEDGAVLRAALLPLTKPTPAADPDDATAGPHSDLRDHGARMWDAYVDIAKNSLTTNLAPESHGARPRVSVLIDYETLRHQTGQGAITDDGMRLSAAAVRRLACDADILPICLGTQGQVLDVGRTQRLVTAALWVALIARDRHCTFPGCTRPPVMCHGHHIRHWADGGPTSLPNLVMLCGHHHRTIHDTTWEVRLTSDGRPEFLPPPRRHTDPDDPPPEWIRHRPRQE